MAFISQPNKDYVRPTLGALSPLFLYLERVRSVSDRLRVTSSNLEYIPIHFGGIKGQQESLIANSVIKVVNFKVTGNE